MHVRVSEREREIERQREKERWRSSHDVTSIWIEMKFEVSELHLHNRLL